MSGMSLNGSINGIASFHRKLYGQLRATGQRCLATKRTASSPTVQASQRKNKIGRAISPQGTSIDSSWPLVDKAHAWGTIEIPAVKAAEFIKQFGKLRGYPAAQARLLSEEWKLSPRTALFFSGILGRTLQPDHVLLSQDLLIAALKQNDAEFIKHMVNKYVRDGRLSHPAAVVALSQLEKFATANDPEALFLLGQVHETKANGTSEARRLYQRVCASSEAKDEAGKSEALIALARLAYTTGDRADAKLHLRDSAFRHDNANAFFLLCNHIEPITSPGWDSCMLKAAASGHHSAAHCLGIYYLAQSLNIIPQDSTSAILSGGTNSIENVSKLQNLAIEWFKIAISAPTGLTFPSSFVLLAILLRSQGKYEEAGPYLWNNPNLERLPKAQVPIGSLKSWNWLNIMKWCTEHWLEDGVDLMKGNWLSDPKQSPQLSIKALVNAWVDERRQEVDGLEDCAWLNWGDCEVHPEVGNV